MAAKLKTTKKATTRKKATSKTVSKRPAPKASKPLRANAKPAPVSPQPAEEPRPIRKIIQPARREALHQMLMKKRQELMKEIGQSIGHRLTDDQQRRLESAMDVGDQSLMDLERELGISLMEMRNKRRQSIDEALARLADSTYGICAECGVEISEKRLDAVPFARMCLECQTKEELLEKIEHAEERD